MSTRAVTLPDGSIVKAEILIKPEDLARGMMFRDSLDADRGMLFAHDKPGRYGYWMYQVRIPLDIVWIDAGRRVVEISANTPPCPSAKASECPSFGGTEEALFVLELKAGTAAQRKIARGTQIDF